jgi:hypothetical protein
MGRERNHRWIDSGDGTNHGVRGLPANDAHLRFHSGSELFGRSADNCFGMHGGFDIERVEDMHQDNASRERPRPLPATGTTDSEASDPSRQTAIGPSARRVVAQ